MPGRNGQPPVRTQGDGSGRYGRHLNVVSALDGLCRVALTSAVPSFSSSQYRDMVRPALGVGELELRRKFAVIARLSLRVRTASAGPSTPVDGSSAGTPIRSPL